MTPTTTQRDIRAAFEAWADRELPYTIKRDAALGYTSLAVSCAWKAWQAAWTASREAALEEDALIADQWSKPDVLRLAAGEMTPQEIRTAQAVAKGIAAAIRQRKDQP